MNIELDRVAVWLPLLIEGINSRPHPINTPYKEKGSDELVNAQKPLQRYVKNYEKDGVRYTLIVRTFNRDATAVEDQLDSIAASLTKAKITKALETASTQRFEYINEYIEESK